MSEDEFVEVDLGEPEEIDPNDPIELRLAERRERGASLRRSAEASFHAMATWEGVKTPQEWDDVCRRAHEDFLDGTFLLERLGAERYLDPYQTATLLEIRRGIIDDWQICSAAELVLLDAAIVSYAHLLRAQGWLGNLEMLIEADFFARDRPRAQLSEKGYNVTGFAAEEHLRRAQEQIMPLVARANKMLITNLRAIVELRRGPAASVRVEQVNIAQQQSNVHVNRGGNHR